jgi:cyclopropane fatty-acyl-phospholipid synthase-like methyltransferase
MEFDINKNYGFWIGGGHDNHLFDEKLAEQLLLFFRSRNISTVVDFGCGTGQYTKHFIAGNVSCEGYDGNPDTAEISGGLCGVLNLAKLVNLNKKFDCVLSLEVGEHIPIEHESNFIQNLETHSNGLIILSWATPGQGGGGHFNEQDNEYVSRKFADLGYVRNNTLESTFRDSSTFPWFRNTIMVFEK